MQVRFCAFPFIRYHLFLFKVEINTLFLVLSNSFLQDFEYFPNFINKYLPQISVLPSNIQGMTGLNGLFEALSVQSHNKSTEAFLTFHMTFRPEITLCSNWGGQNLIWTCHSTLLELPKCRAASSYQNFVSSKNFMLVGGWVGG